MLKCLASFPSVKVIGRKWTEEKAVASNAGEREEFSGGDQSVVCFRMGCVAMNILGF